MRPFLTAQWRDLVVLNFTAPPEFLIPYVPLHTELDLHGGRAYMSLVAFRFIDTKVLGYRIPFHNTFEEINLRFYVRRTVDGSIRRGVVFIKELVPKRAIALVARLVYNENYFAVPMHHSIENSGNVRRLQFGWKDSVRWNSIGAEVTGDPIELNSGSEAQFILEHYWGYSRTRFGETIEYEVAHPPWRAWHQASASIDIDVSATYGEAFNELLGAKWHSAYVAEGSPILVYPGRKLHGNESS